MPAGVGIPMDFEDAELGTCGECHNLHEVGLADKATPRFELLLSHWSTESHIFVAVLHEFTLALENMARLTLFPMV